MFNWEVASATRGFSPVARTCIAAVALAGSVLWSGEATASECATMDPADITAQDYAGHWEAYDSLACLEESLIASGDRRAIFTSVYTLTTLRMAEAIDAEFFDDTTWMQSYQTEFANYFRRAFYHYETGNLNAVADAWVTAFDAAASGETLMIQDILLGMNAHINRDLCYALEDVNINPRAPKYADHTLVNEVLGDVSDEIMYAMTQVYGTNFAQLDAALGNLDELLLSAGFFVAREGAWNNAVSLDNSRWWNRWLVIWWIEGVAAGNADLTLASIGPGAHAALSHLEGTNPGSTFCQHFTCAN